MSGPGLTIGALSARAQVRISAIRYYEEIGLLPAAARTADGKRLYQDADVKRLLFIRHCRDFGFPIAQVRELVRLFDGDRTCGKVRDIAQIHLTAVQTRLAAMRELEATLAALVTHCSSPGCGGPAQQCEVIEDLASAEPAFRPPLSAQCCNSFENQDTQPVPARPSRFSEVKRS